MHYGNKNCGEDVMKLSWKLKKIENYFDKVSHIHPYSSALTAMQSVFVKGFDALIFVNDFPVWHSGVYSFTV